MLLVLERIEIENAKIKGFDDITKSQSQTLLTNTKAVTLAASKQEAVKEGSYAGFSMTEKNIREIISQGYDADIYMNYVVQMLTESWEDVLYAKNLAEAASHYFKGEYKPGFEYEIRRKLRFDDNTSSIKNQNTKKVTNKSLARKLNKKAIPLIHKNKLTQAIPLLSQASDLDPNNAEVLGNYGYALYLSGNLREAKKASSDALKIKPKRGSTWVNLGQVLSYMGDTRQATKCFIKYYNYSSKKNAARNQLKLWASKRGTLQDSAKQALRKLGL